MTVPREESTKQACRICAANGKESLWSHEHMQEVHGKITKNNMEMADNEYEAALEHLSQHSGKYSTEHFKINNHELEETGKSSGCVTTMGTIQYEKNGVEQTVECKDIIVDCSLCGLNTRPLHLQCNALPTELRKLAVLRVTIFDGALQPWTAT